MYRPQNKEELFNLCHASVCNVIECIFGVLKCQFCILLLAPEYNMNIQGQITTTLCAIHNFICMHDSEEMDKMLLETQPFIDSDDPDLQFPVGAMTRENTELASIRRDQIAQEMWEDYLHVLYD